MKDQTSMNRREFLSVTAGMGAVALCPSVLGGCGESSDDRDVYRYSVSSAWIGKGEEENINHQV